jgi:hypothetical protein
VRHPGDRELILRHKGSAPARLLHISCNEFPGKLEDVALVLLVHKRGIFPHGIDRVENAGKGFVLHLDQVDRLFRNLRVRGRHRRNLVPVRSDLTGLQHRLVLKEPIPDLRYVVRSDHGPYTHELLGSGSIDPYDPRMGIFAAEDLPVKHPRDLEVLDIGCPSGHLVDGIFLGDPLSYAAKIFHGNLLKLGVAD